MKWCHVFPVLEPVPRGPRTPGGHFEIRRGAGDHPGCKLTALLVGFGKVLKKSAYYRLGSFKSLQRYKTDVSQIFHQVKNSDKVIMYITRV